MALRRVKYFVVNDVGYEVSDAAPEIVVEVASAGDVAAALLSRAGVPSNAEIYTQTFRPDGSARWQAVSAVHELPEASLLLAKIVRPKVPEIMDFSAPCDPAADADGGGVPDREQDNAGDGLPDGLEVLNDVDRDGVPDEPDADRDGIPNYIDHDKDGDGAPDDWDSMHGRHKDAGKSNSEKDYEETIKNIAKWEAEEAKWAVEEANTGSG